MSLRTEVNNYFAQDRIRDHFSRGGGEGGVRDGVVEGLQN